jgi:hypothetical protein
LIPRCEPSPDHDDDGDVTMAELDTSEPAPTRVSSRRKRAHILAQTDDQGEYFEVCASCGVESPHYDAPRKATIRRNNHERTPRQRRKRMNFFNAYSRTLFSKPFSFFNRLFRLLTHACVHWL